MLFFIFKEFFYPLKRFFCAAQTGIHSFIYLHLMYFIFFLTSAHFFVFIACALLDAKRCHFHRSLSFLFPACVRKSEMTLSMTRFYSAFIWKLTSFSTQAKLTEKGREKNLMAQRFNDGFWAGIFMLFYSCPHGALGEEGGRGMRGVCLVTGMSWGGNWSFSWCEGERGRRGEVNYFLLSALQAFDWSFSPFQSRNSWARRSSLVYPAVCSIYIFTYIHVCMSEYLCIFRLYVHFFYCTCI